MKHIAFVCWAFMLFCLVFFTARESKAADLEVGIGASQYLKKTDGYWYQDGFQNNLDLKAPVIEVGVTGPLWRQRNYGLDYHADWVYLGTVHTQAVAVTDDANYNTVTKQCNGPCGPQANFVGSGHDQGFAFTLEPYYEYGGWRYAVEAGPYLHRSTFSEAVYDWRMTFDQPGRTVYVQTKREWKVSYVVGASVGKGPFTVAYQYFSSDAHGDSMSSTVWKGTHVLLLKYKF